MNDEQLNAAVELVRVAAEVNKQGVFDAHVNVDAGAVRMFAFVSGTMDEDYRSQYADGFTAGDRDCNYYPEFMAIEKLHTMQDKLRTLLIDEDAAS